MINYTPVTHSAEVDNYTAVLLFAFIVLVFVICLVLYLGWRRRK